MDPTLRFQTARGNYVATIHDGLDGPTAMVCDRSGRVCCEFVGYADREWLWRAVREVAPLLDREGLL